MAIQSRNYRSPAFEQLSESNTQGIKGAQDLAQLLLRGKQSIQQQDRDAQLKEALMGKQHDLDLQGSSDREKHVMDLVAENPNMGFSATKEGFSATPKPPKDNSLQQESLATRQDALGLRTVKAIKDDYNQQVGKSPSRVIAAQAILDALKSNDMTTQGRIKALLPQLEGENYKPTDKERELILQATGEGVGSKLKNFLGMNTPGISVEQSTALDQYARNRMTEEQGIMGRGKAEVMKRYGASANALSPEQLQDVESSLGMASGELSKINQARPAVQPGTQLENLGRGVLPSKAPTSNLSPPQSAFQGGSLSPAEQERLNVLRAKHKPPVGP